MKLFSRCFATRPPWESFRVAGEVMWAIRGYPLTLTLLHAFAIEQGYVVVTSDERRHHEVYPGDPRKTSADKPKTVVRRPVRRL